MVNKRTPRFAFIIQCHKNPQQINMLMDSLQKIYDCHIFLHLDKKNYRICDAIQSQNITLLQEEKSVNVQWGEFSQCQATLNLIDAVFSSGMTFDYIWLISGQDLPIAGREQVSAFLSNEAVPYIDVFGEDDPIFPSFAKRNDIYYFNCMYKRNLTSGILRRAYKFLTGGREHTWSILRRSFKFPYYFGSSWWCLPYDCVKEMMDVLNQSKEIIPYFQHAMNSDESFFQTLFMQTSYAGKQKPIAIYVDWSEGLASPRTLTIKDYPALQQIGTKYLMARKFDFSTDEQVCIKVLEELCELSS